MNAPQHKAAIKETLNRFTEGNLVEKHPKPTQHTRLSERKDPSP